MLKCRSMFLLVMIASALVFLPGDTMRAKDNTMLKKQLAETIATVRKGETPTIRTDAAEHLAELTRSLSPKRIDDGTLSQIVSLLDTSEDSVRLWVAASLGNLGPRAKMAAPKLLELLPQADCLHGSVTSASAIRIALTRIGVTPPPPRACNN